MIAQNQPDTSSPLVGVDHSIDLEVTWNGKAWKVNVPHYDTLIPSTGDPQFSLPSTSVPMIPPPACASLNSFLNTPTTYATFATPFGTTEGSNPKAVSWGFVVGANEAAGCLGVVVPAPNTTATPTDFKQPPAYFLYRNGVLYAANALAHSEFPGVPLADGYEQSIAQQIAANYKM